MWADLAQLCLDKHKDALARAVYVRAHMMHALEGERECGDRCLLASIFVHSASAVTLFKLV